MVLNEGCPSHDTTGTARCALVFTDPTSAVDSVGRGVPSAAVGRQCAAVRTTRGATSVPVQP